MGSADRVDLVRFTGRFDVELVQSVRGEPRTVDLGPPRFNSAAGLGTAGGLSRARKGDAPPAKHIHGDLGANFWRIAHASAHLVSVTTINGAVVYGERGQDTVAFRAEELVHAAPGHVADVGDIQVKRRDL
jgi:hypothetical protein